ncbi:MAG: SRPBCC family protein [Planctomycetota bacterium]
MPRPVRLAMTRVIDRTPEQIGAILCDLDRWEIFPGWGPMPGIASATLLVGPRGAAPVSSGVSSGVSRGVAPDGAKSTTRKIGAVHDDLAGSRVAVRCTDGSAYVEEITEWDPPRRIRIRLGEFSPPLGRLATHFDEAFAFEAMPESGDHPRTRVRRELELYPRRWFARPALWLIRPMLAAAIARHMAMLDDDDR